MTTVDELKARGSPTVCLASTKRNGDETSTQYFKSPQAAFVPNLPVFAPATKKTDQDSSFHQTICAEDEYEEASDVHRGFPRKLFMVLGMSEYNDIISWLPHGRGFIVRDRDRLTEIILPKHFKKAKYTAFTRKLNRWNFTRVTLMGPDRGSYYNPFFQRDNRKLSQQMSCVTGKRLAAQDPPPLSINPFLLGVPSPMQSIPIPHFQQQPVHLMPRMPQQFLMSHAQAFMMNQMYWMQQQQQQMCAAGVPGLPLSPAMMMPSSPTTTMLAGSDEELSAATKYLQQRWESTMMMPATFDPGTTNQMSPKNQQDTSLTNGMDNNNELCRDKGY